jgi:hypothetical protein
LRRSLQRELFGWAEARKECWQNVSRSRSVAARLRLCATVLTAPDCRTTNRGTNSWSADGQIRADPEQHSRRTAPHRTAPHRTAPHRTAPHRTAL